MTTILKKKIPANSLTLLMFSTARSASIRPDRLTNATAVRNITLDGSQDVHSPSSFLWFTKSAHVAEEHYFPNENVIILTTIFNF